MMPALKGMWWLLIKKIGYNFQKKVTFIFYLNAKGARGNDVKSGLQQNINGEEAVIRDANNGQRR